MLKTIEFDDAILPLLLANSRGVRQKMTNGYLTPLLRQPSEIICQPVIEADFTLQNKQHDRRCRELFGDRT